MVAGFPIQPEVPVEQVVVDAVVDAELETQEPRELQTLVEVVEQVLFQLQQVGPVDLEL